ncbi:hypothetical protein FPZ12_001540 [Amycolatopsis acidicola]|uniref:Uncharacterized protein n=1 Tax=Amycolatopsis acidicola TaxID=2596893 RepID=A0A5N0VNW5_9PSEU|nr:hypothetical protein [Amycolatopsis acidicola]KAA9166900.1 hypothetical protein FPZ12_001540 [Amycolatopsis acidicola]
MPAAPDRQPGFAAVIVVYSVADTGLVFSITVGSGGTAAATLALGSKKIGEVLGRIKRPKAGE